MSKKYDKKKDRYRKRSWTMLKWCRKQANPEPNIMSYFGETETDRSGNAMFAEENGLIKQITNGW